MEIREQEFIVLASLIFLTLVLGLNGLLLVSLFVVPGYVLLGNKNLNPEERLLLSFPASLILVVWPLSLLQSLLPLDFLLFGVFGFLVIFLYQVSKSIKGKIKVKFDEGFLFFILLLGLFFLWYRPMLNNALPLGDAASHYFRVWDLAKSLKEQYRLSEWCPYWYSGFSLTLFYPPLAYLVPAYLSSLTSLLGAFSSSYFFILFFLLVSFYLFVKKYTSWVTGFALSAILLCVPNLVGLTFYVGMYTTIFTLCFLPVSLYLLFGGGKKLRWLFLPWCAMLLSHHLTFYFLAAASLPFIVPLVRENWKELAIAGFLTLFISSPWLATFFVNLKYTSMGTSLPDFTFREVWDKLNFVPANEEACSQHISDLACLLTLTPYLIGLFFLSIVFVILTKQWKGLLPVVSVCIIVILLFAHKLGLEGIIPLAKNAAKQWRAYTFFIPFMLLTIGAGLRELEKRIGYGILVVPVVWILLVGFWQGMGAKWVREKAPVDYEMFGPIYKALGPDGRTVVFGIYGPAMYTAIPIMTGYPVLGGFGYESAINFQKIWGRLGPDVADRLNPDVDGRFVVNLLRRTGTKYIILNTCDYYGGQAATKIFQPFKEEYDVLLGTECYGVVSLKERKPFVEQTTVFRAGEVDIENVMKTKDGWKYEFSESIGDNFTQTSVPSSNQLFYQRTYEKIWFTVNNTRLVIVRESWSPKWKAYLGGAEVPIHQSDLGYMIVQPSKAGIVELRYEKSWYEILLSILVIAWSLYDLRTTVFVGKS